MRPDYPPTRTSIPNDGPDPFRWLEERTAEVSAWSEAQDRLARGWLSRLPQRDQLVPRLRQMVYLESAGVPVRRGGRLFHLRRRRGHEKDLLVWRASVDGPEQILLDPQTWSADDNRSLGTWRVSTTGRKVAYQVRVNASDEATLHVIDVDRGMVSAVDTIEGGRHAEPAWTADDAGFYYVWTPADPSLSASGKAARSEIRFHQLGRDPASDPIVFGATGDPRTTLSAKLSSDGRWLFVSVHFGWTRTDVWFADQRTGGALRPLAIGHDALYEPVAAWGSFYVRTNDGAPRWCVRRVNPDRPDRAHWVEVVRERADATLDAFSVIGGRLTLLYLQGGVTRLEIAGLDGSPLADVRPPALGTVELPIGDPDDDLAFFAFQSFARPPEVHALSVESGTTRIWSSSPVVDPADFRIDLLEAISRDRTPIPLWVVTRRDFRRDGTGRALLYGYGGFQVAVTPEFRPIAIPWLEQGGVYAVAVLRGGSEFGEEWHRAGMRERKQNVFDDFLACAELLVERRYTSPTRLVARGASNGGLLVGAAITQRPELFRAALCGVPILDMLRYHLHGAGMTWVEEYGNPDDARVSEAIRRYSPYHRVSPGIRYPSVLLLSADSDDRVDPMHARKFAAALQAASMGGPVLLRIERRAGHGGADVLKDDIERMADELAFALAETADAPEN